MKPSNILLSYSDVPVLVDFGFAQKWDLSAIDLRGTGDTRLDLHTDSHKEPFFSEISWGTPEYLDPPVSETKMFDTRRTADNILTACPGPQARRTAVRRLVARCKTAPLAWSVRTLKLDADQVTFFEILCGRTPFEVSEEEDFSTPEQLKVYYERTLTGLWIGDWSMSKRK